MIEFDRSPNGYLELYVSGNVDSGDVDLAASWLEGVLPAGVALSFYVDLCAVEDIATNAIDAAFARFASLADGARFVERIALVVEHRHVHALEPLVRSLPPCTTVRCFAADDAASARLWLLETSARRNGWLGVSLVLPLSARTSLAGVGGYARLAGDAADSPPGRERGSIDRGTIGLIGSCRFGGESGRGAPPDSESDD